MSLDPIIIIGRDQSCLAFCDLGCFNTFTVYQDCSDLEDAKTLKKVRLACYYCAGCGRIVNKPKTCMLHDNECPDYLWYASYPHMYDFLDEWISQFGEVQITDIVWETADAISKANPLISGVDLAQLTIKKLGY